MLVVSVEEGTWHPETAPELCRGSVVTGHGGVGFELPGSASQHKESQHRLDSSPLHLEPVLNQSWTLSSSYSACTNRRNKMPCVLFSAVPYSSAVLTPASALFC